MEAGLKAGGGSTIPYTKARTHVLLSTDSLQPEADELPVQQPLKHDAQIQEQDKPIMAGETTGGKMQGKTNKVPDRKQTKQSKNQSEC